MTQQRDDTAATSPVRHRTDAGFSLIEALVALAVLAIATVGLIGAVEQHIDSTRAMERRAAAMWIAENRLAEIDVGDAAALGGDQVAMLDQTWRIETTRKPTGDPEISRIDIRVYGAADKTPTATLNGFADQPKPVERRL